MAIMVARFGSLSLVLSLVVGCGLLAVQARQRAAADSDLSGNWGIEVKVDLPDAGLHVTIGCVASIVEHGANVTLFTSCDDSGFSTMLTGIRTEDDSLLLTGMFGGTDVTIDATVKSDASSFEGMVTEPKGAGTVGISGTSGIHSRGVADCYIDSVHGSPRTVANSKDAALIAQSAAALISRVPCPWLADVNLDGTVDAIDSLLVLQFSAGLISDFPP